MGQHDHPVAGLLPELALPEWPADRLKTLCGIERMNGPPPLLCSNEALRPLGGFKAQHVRQGGCQQGTAQRQGERGLRA